MSPSISFLTNSRNFVLRGVHTVYHCGQRVPDQVFDHRVEARARKHQHRSHQVVVLVAWRPAPPGTEPFLERIQERLRCRPCVFEHEVRF